MHVRNDEMNNRLTRAVTLLRIIAVLHALPAGYFLWWFVCARIDGISSESTYGFDLLGLFFGTAIAAVAFITAWCASRLRQQRVHAWFFSVCMLVLHSLSLWPLPFTIPALLALVHPETRETLRNESTK